MALEVRHAIHAVLPGRDDTLEHALGCEKMEKDCAGNARFL